MNKRGIAEVAILVYVIAGLCLLFVPNPLSNAVGVGIRPNKTIQTEKVELIKDAQGNPIALRTITRNDDIQQHVTFWEWLMSLPVFVLFLMGMGVIFPPISLFLGKIYNSLKDETKKIVVSVDHALDHVHDPEVKAKFYDAMERKQDKSTKALVDKIQGKV